MLDFHFINDCESLVSSHLGIDTPFVQESQPVSSEAYIPPLNIYKYGVNDNGKTLYRIKEGSVDGFIPTMNGVQIDTEGSEFVLENGQYLYIKVGNTSAEIVDYKGTTTGYEAYILLGGLDADGKLHNYLNSSIRTYHCGAEWVYFNGSRV